MPRHARTLRIGGKAPPLQQRTVSAPRPSSHARGYTYAWRKAAALYLQEHPLCECPDCCAGARRVRPATVVDHRIPHKGDARLFWDRSNWQAMHKQCHDRKTAREDGGFGRPGVHADPLLCPPEIFNVSAHEG